MSTEQDGLRFRGYRWTLREFAEVLENIRTGLATTQGQQYIHKFSRSAADYGVVALHMCCNLRRGAETVGSKVRQPWGRHGANHFCVVGPYLSCSALELPVRRASIKRIHQQDGERYGCFFVFFFKSCMKSKSHPSVPRSDCIGLQNK